MGGQERRRHPRVKVDKRVTVRDGAAAKNGRVTDISPGGAAVNMEEADELLVDDQALELDLENFGTVAGNVVRTLDDGFAMAFDLDDESEDLLISEITGYRSGVYSE